jgi:hypothetical protein
MISKLIPIALALAALGLFLGYVQPTYSGSIAALQTEIKDLDTALVAAREFKDKEVQLTQERATIPDGQLARLESALPDSVDNVQLIVDLNSLAARSGVELSQFNIGTAASDASSGQPDAALTSGEPTESLEISVSATATYASFRIFLEGIETSLRPLDVVELSVQDSDTGVYTYDMTLRFYWLR